MAGPPAFDFLRSVMLFDSRALEEPKKQSRLDFVMRWQQITGAVMAKGVEDTAFYRYFVLISLNDVGGNPGGSGTSVDEFHRAMQFRQQHMPCTLNATSTHDTKRSEDVRARVNVLSELPGSWAKALQRWHKLNRTHQQTANGDVALDPNDEILFYQTLIGTWPFHAEKIPLLRDRLKEYMIKAIREAKVHTDWLSPKADYELAVSNFLESLLRQSEGNSFLEDYLRFHKTVAPLGAVNSLSQVLLKITAPGIPDFYQGTELWDFSLVDPDNRRPVDFKLRVEVLEESRRKASANLMDFIAELLVQWQDGRIKLFLMQRALDFRRANPDLFLEGEYIPIEVRGPRNTHVCAFARRLGRLWCLVVVPRLVSKFTPPGKFPLGKEAWKGTVLTMPKAAPKQWVDILTERTCGTASRGKGPALPLRNILGNFPVALLSSPQR
jgi:(1->4)-alpha-D-glucan 1-alpha-D-glucosylmutase